MALATVTGVPAWQLINVAIDLLWKGQEEDVRALVGKLAPRLAARYLKGED